MSPAGQTADILGRLAEALAPDGHFIMGAAETIVGVTDVFVPVTRNPSVFVKRVSV